MVPSIGDKQELAEKIIHDLLGTVNSIPEEHQDDADICQFIDEQIWLCEECGWWVEVGETDEDGICEDCRGS